MCVYICVCMYVYMYIYIYVCMCMYICAYVYTHVCMYVYVYMCICIHIYTQAGFTSGSVVKTLPANIGATGDMGWISELGKSSGGGSGNPLQYSCLGNPMDKGAWWATIHGIANSWT